MLEIINAEKVILHILDPSVGLPVLSEEEHPSNGEIMEFIDRHIENVFRDVNAKKSFFKEEDNPVKKLCQDIAGDNTTFIQKTKEVAFMLYNILAKNPDIPPCDFICSLFDGDGKPYLGFFLFNYKTSYIHYVEELEKGRINTVLKQSTTLANINQVVDEFFIIDLEDFSILLKEKKYEINGEKDFYLSKHLLKSEDLLSDKAKMDIVNKVSKKIIKDYYDNDVAKLAEVKSAMIESVEESETIDVDLVKTRVFKNNPDIQQKYDEEIEKKGLVDKTIDVNQNLNKKISRFQKLVMDNGIEVKIPIEYLSQDDKIEFLNNNDGTVSVLLKAIKDIQGK